MVSGSLNEIHALEFLFQKGKGFTVEEFQAWKASVLFVLSSKPIPPGSWSGHLETYLLLRPHLRRYLGPAVTRDNIKDEAPLGLKDFNLSEAFCRIFFSGKWAEIETESLLLDFYNHIFLCIASKQEGKPLQGLDPSIVGSTSPTLAQILLRGKRILGAVNFFDNISIFEKLISDVLSQVSLAEFPGSDSSTVAARQLLVKGMHAAGTQMHLFLSTPPSMKMALPFIPTSTVVDMKDLETDSDDVRNRRRQERRFSVMGQSALPNSGSVVPFNKKAKVTVSNLLSNSLPLSPAPSSSGGSASTAPSSVASASLKSAFAPSSSVISTISVPTGSKKHEVLLKGGNMLETPWGSLNLRAVATELKDPRLITGKDWGYLVATKKDGKSGLEGLAWSRLEGRALGLPARKIPAADWQVCLQHFH
jgi:hypothetical protein